MPDNSTKKHARKLRNFLLQPALQIKIGLYSVVLALVFVVVFSAVLVISFERLFELILILTDQQDEVMSVIYQQLYSIAGWLLLVVLVYVIANVFQSILYTHKLVGPAIAFRRHTRALIDGDYKSRITLRKADAFNEVAEDLNHLAATLENKSK